MPGFVSRGSPKSQPNLIHRSGGKAGTRNDTITVGPFSLTPALAIDGGSGDDHIVYAVQVETSSQSITFGAADIKLNSAMVLTHSRVESAKNLLINATDGSDAVALTKEDARYIVGSSAAIFADIDFDETFIWGDSPCGNMLIWTSDGRAGWYNLGSHDIEILGSIGDTINWVFTE